ncbi:hypothetical protein [Zoogloea sp.]|uniref:hypothetical protein n=1 Tax=Zoogloea sp. TaxID=49181 RepID=UPI0035AE4A18
MVSEAAARPQRELPQFRSLRPPMDHSPYGLATNAFQVWRMASHGEGCVPAGAAGNPAEEYKSVCEFMRLYATLRFYQLALLLGTTGSLVSALASTAVRVGVARPDLLRAGGLILSLAFMVMEFRASSYWHGMRQRGNELAHALGYQPFPVSSRWHPLTTSGASFYLHVAVAVLWGASLIHPLHASPTL